MFEVRKAKRSRRPLKISLEGLSGSGKTFTALRAAFAMRRAGIGKRIVVADSENESAGLYDGIVIDGEKWEYETCPITPDKQNPVGYTEVYEFLAANGFDLIVIDSMTHAWKGALARVDQVAARNGNDKFGAGWRAVTPEQERMMQVLTDGRAHLITTTRVKGDYEQVEKSNGKMKWEKVGLKADQRDGMDYEYDVVLRLEREDHAGIVEKVRGCTAMDGKVGKMVGPEFWKPLFDWWLSAEPVVSEYDRLAAILKTARNQEELRAAWGMMGVQQQELMRAVKDACKERLSVPVAPVVPVVPAEPVTLPFDPISAIDDESAERSSLWERFTLICTHMDINAVQLLERFWRPAKLAHVKIKPMPKELTTDQLGALVTAGEEELDKIAALAAAN